ncbi:hypothetical protein BDY19DRAFT_1051219 [Irpex rosettiformis]|uniref:Uncharacterized protein n=1 Tax=Irpex rosettiformis TaxID=378272 RepID=A0ACB8TQU3_9APHY|nr:hypothetical protein BDY19DRAFT_1051219 [Irpex rosettiformis]
MESEIHAAVDPQADHMQNRHHLIFPPELLGAIFDDVVSLFPDEAHSECSESSHRTLYTSSSAQQKRCFDSFSLVCRQWQELSQVYLYRTLALEFCHEEIPHKRTLAEILAWQRLYPYLSCHVRNVKLVMFSEYGGYTDAVEGCDPRLLHTILHHFTKLRSVDLVDITFGSGLLQEYFSAPSVNWDISARPPLLKLDELKLHYTNDSFSTVDSTLVLLSWFSEVNNVLIQHECGLNWIAGIPLDDRKALIPANLKTPLLTIKSFGLDQGIIEHLLASPTFSAGILQKLTISVDGSGQNEVKLLPSASQSGVHELCLDMIRWYRMAQEDLLRSTGAQILNMIAFKDTTYLSFTRLTLKIPELPYNINTHGGISNTYLNAQSALSFFLGFIFLPVVSVQTVALVIVIGDGCEIQSDEYLAIRAACYSFGWFSFRFLDDVLPELKAVESVEVTMEGEQGKSFRLSDEQQSEARASLKRLDEKGLLRF